MIYILSLVVNMLLYLIANFIISRLLKKDKFDKEFAKLILFVGFGLIFTYWIGAVLLFSIIGVVIPVSIMYNSDIEKRRKPKGK